MKDHKMPELRFALLAGVLMPLLGSIPAQARTTYSAVKMFNLSQNPQAPWGYYTNGTVLGTFDSQVRGIAGLDGWTNGAPEPSDVIVAKNRTGGGVIHSNGVAYFEAYLTMDPEAQPNVAVRFVAPKSGSYRIKGKFVSLDNSEQSHTVEVQHNGVVILSFTIDAVNFQAPIRNRISLAAGDTLDFVCDTAGDGTHLSTGVAATITGP